MEDAEKNKEEVKASRLNEAYALINKVGANITPKKINAAKAITIFVMIAGILIFNLPWKIKGLMVGIFIVGLVVLVALFALESFYLGNDMTNIKSKDEREKDNKKPKDDESKGGLESLGIPSAEDYSKQAEEGMFGSGYSNDKPNNSKKPKKSKHKEKPFTSDDLYNVGMDSINPVSYEDLFGKR